MTHGDMVDVQGPAGVSAPVTSASAFALVREVAVLAERLRLHKRMVRQHRAAARECAQQLKQLQQSAAQQGVRLDISEGDLPHGEDERGARGRHPEPVHEAG